MLPFQSKWRWGGMEPVLKNPVEIAHKIARIPMQTSPDACQAVYESPRSSIQLHRGSPLMSPPMMLRVPNLGLESAPSHTARFGSSSNPLDGVPDGDGGAASPKSYSEPTRSEESENSVMMEPAPEPMQDSFDTASIINEACSIAVQSMINTASAHYNCPCELNAVDSEEAAAALNQAHQLQEQYCIKARLNLAQEQHSLGAKDVEGTRAKTDGRTDIVDSRRSHPPSSCAPSRSRYVIPVSNRRPSIPQSRQSSLASKSGKSTPPSRQSSGNATPLSRKSSASPNRQISASPVHRQQKSRASSNESSGSRPIAQSNLAARIKTSIATPNRQRVASGDAAIRHLAGFGFRPPRPLVTKGSDVAVVVTVADLQNKSGSVSPAKTREVNSSVQPKSHGKQADKVASIGRHQSAPTTVNRSSSARQHSNIHPAKAGVAGVSPNLDPFCLGAASSKRSPQASLKSKATPLHWKTNDGPLRSNSHLPPQRASTSPPRQTGRSISPFRSNNRANCKSPEPACVSTPSNKENCKSTGPSRSSTPRSRVQIPSRQYSAKSAPSAVPSGARSRSNTPPSKQSVVEAYGEQQAFKHARSRSPVMRESSEPSHQKRNSTSPSARAKPSLPATPRGFSDDKESYAGTSPKARPATPIASRIESRLVEVVNEILKPQPSQTRVEQNQAIHTEHIIIEEVNTPCDSIELSYEKMWLGEPIGSGSFGTVWRGSYGGEIMAVKQCIVNDTRDKETLQGELRCLRRFSHPRLVSFFGCCSNRTNFFILMEYMPGGSLHELLFKSRCKLEFADQARMAGEVCQGLSYLHRLDVVHRDLKTMNIVLDTLQRCKICDFGLTLMLEKSHCTVRAMQGSPRYMAPEQFEAVVKITSKVDIWQFGCVLLELFCLSVPFSKCVGIQQIATELLVRRKPPAVPSETNPIAKVIISACLRMRASLRPTSEALEKAFEKLRS